MSIENPTLVHFRHYSHFRHLIITYFQTHSILTNKPNFENDKMNITLDMTSKYENLPAGSGQKTKPIQTQFNPKQTQFKANKAKNKPNSNPIKANKITLKIYPFGINCPIVYMIFGIRL